MENIELPTFNLNIIKFKLVNTDKANWTKEKAQRVELDYRKFLALTKLYPDETIVPSEEIDTFWHAHILDTKKYRQDTNTYFGFFLEHYPYLGMMGARDREELTINWEKTKKLFEIHFGSTLKDAFKPFGEVTRASCGASCAGNYPPPVHFPINETVLN